MRSGMYMFYCIVVIRFENQMKKEQERSNAALEAKLAASQK